MITVNTKQIKQYENDLKDFKRSAFPFATRQTIHQAAVMARFIAVDLVREKMITRNAFTRQSIQFSPSKPNQITLRVSRQEATVGSIAPYMEDQEFGGTKTSRGKRGVPIATSYAAGQAQNAQPRTRLPRKLNKMASIQLSSRRKKGKTRRQRNLVAIKQAAESSNKFVFLDLGRTKGIFKVVGGKRKPRLRMVWSMGHRSVVIPKNPWLLPAVDKTQLQMPRLYRDALRFQLQRHGLFR